MEEGGGKYWETKAVIYPADLRNSSSESESESESHQDNRAAAGLLGQQALMTGKDHQRKRNEVTAYGIFGESFT